MLKRVKETDSRLHWETGILHSCAKHTRTYCYLTHKPNAEFLSNQTHESSQLC